MLTEIIIILVLILLNGILSASEIAIVSSRKARLQAAATDKKNKAAIAALKLKNNPNLFLSTVQIGITLIGILTGFFSGGTISTFFAEYLAQIDFIAPYSQQIAVVLVILVITYLSLVVGELVPKRIGMAIPETYSILIAPVMQFLSKIMRPFVWLLSSSTEAFVKLFNLNVSKNMVTEEEIKALVDEGVDSGVIENFEHDIMDRLLLLGDKRARNLMVHRSDIECLDLQDTLAENKEIIRKAQHTEFPVVDGSFDQVRGIIHVKAFIKNLIDEKPIELEKLIEPVPFVNENSYASSILEVFKNTKSQLAIVIDEYGIPQGIVSIKDIVRSLFGDLDSDQALQNVHLTKREDGSFLVDGRMQLTDFFNHFNIILDEEEDEEYTTISTVGGLVFLTLDHVPLEGEFVFFKGYRIEVIDLDGHRIDKVLVESIKGLNSIISENTD